MKGEVAQPIPAEELHGGEVIGRPQVVAILDAGGQYVDLVKKASERLGYAAEVVPLDTPINILEQQYKALIISGSPANSQETDAPMPDPAVWESDMPVLGICYGMQAMAGAFGGSVERGLLRQDGRVKTSVDTKHPLFQDTKADQQALFTHGNFVTQVPDNVEVIGKHELGETTVYSAISRGNKVGVQFHPEVFDDTPEGYQIFKNFLGNIAGLEPDPELINDQTEAWIAKARAEIRKQAGDKHVIAFVSGGVDSSVATKLAASEIDSDKLHAYYIDNGFMRDEDDAVIDLLRHLGIPVMKVEAEDYFMNATMEEDGNIVGPLSEVMDPQKKRQIIGKAFIEVQNQLVASLGLEEALLLQGTNAADRIESGHSKGGTHTALIKTHHNQVKEVQDLKAQGLLLEPLDELFKDEVRTVGRFLSLPPEVVDRHPFPGPGTAIRILCARSNRFEKPDRQIEVDIHKFVTSNTPSHYIDSKLLPIRNVGVGGDERSHVSAVALQSSASWETLHELAVKLPARFRDHINRVIVAVGEGKIDELRMTPTFLTSAARNQLRHADRIVFEEMRETGVIDMAKQVPVVLLPLSFGKEGDRSIVLRPVMTSTFMTVQAMLPERDMPTYFVHRTAERIQQEVPGISQVFLDLTGKPPGTTEWE